ncbi:MAG: glycosyltransferase 87 family protein, partial [Candidatus Veblenbacteria bacterium]|nr:glycosyltransferase 87 family protein [Candidatus Veblenbacteria bacterium]
LTLATDSTIQTEVALQYLAEGRNPYVEDYYGTELEKYPYPKRLASANPALEYFVYLPTLVWLSYPVYELAQWGLGFFDQRFTLMLATLALVWLVWRELKWKPEVAVLLAPCLIASPWFAYNLLAGQNDALPLMLVVAALVLWHHERFVIGATVLALAATTKQTVWFVLPFAAFYLWQVCHLRWGERGGVWWWRQVGLFAGVALLALLPFLWWNAAALWQDTVGYIIGTTTITYPIWGVGLAELLFRLGAIPSRQAEFPFAWLQLIVALPLLLWLLYHQRRLPPHLAYVIGAWGLGLGSSWLVGRFFAPAHLGFIITTLALVYLVRYFTPYAGRASGLTSL